MIVFFSSMPKAEGTVQFMLSFADALLANGEDVRIFAEHGVCDDAPGYVRFDHVKTSEIVVGISKRIKDCCRQILNLNPKMVIFTDDALGGVVLRRMLAGKIKCVLVQHDPEPHPTNSSKTIKDRVWDLLTARWVNNQNKYVDNYLLLSNTSKTRFTNLYPDLVDKCSVMSLCPHPPKCSKAVIPSELVDITKVQHSFFLFFGRIDKYKGIERLLEAYSSYSGTIPLVIAGSGEFTPRESALLDSINNVYLIHRYVSDEDLVWLFSNCRAVMLPYIEASQSGVLAMAYHFGKPVAVSNLPGLTEFVIEGKTGLICNNISDFANAMELFDSNADSMQPEIVAYAKEQLDWNRQVKQWLMSL